MNSILRDMCGVLYGLILCGNTRQEMETVVQTYIIIILDEFYCGHK
jgi:hypothetical protein